MDTPLYKVIFSGDLEEGCAPDVVKRQCAVLFKQPPAQIEPLFAGSPVTIKSGLTRQQAEKYVRALRDIGAKARIAAATDSTAAASPSRSRARSKSAAHPKTEVDRLLAGFKGRVEPVAVPPAYRLGIAGVSVVMLLLPLLYVLLTCLVVYGTVYYASHNLGLFQRPGSFYVALILYATPVAAGTILTLFMLKPWLSVAGRKQAETILVRSQQPRFFKFVYRVCDAVGAPRPEVIGINNDVYASAGFHQGMRGFFSGKLALTVGLPLIAGLNTRQLAGVLAHEFGHFSQGAGLQTAHIIRRVNRGFSAAVFQRDSLDQWLERRAASEYSAVQIATQAPRLLVSATRRLLWALMQLGDAVSAWVSRQMEFDADRYQARVAGSAAFKHTAIQRVRLSLAHAEVMRNLGASWENHQRLVGDLSAAVLRTVLQQPRNIGEKIEKDMELARSEWYDTHPSAIERIENVMHEDAAGIFHVELPARSLFLEFAEVSSDSTYDYYRRQLLLDVTKSQLIPVEEFTHASDDQRRHDLALDVFFSGAFSVYVPMQNSAPPALAGQQKNAMLQGWKKQRELMRNLAGQAKLAYRRLGECEQKLNDIVLARAYAHAGRNIDARELGLADARPETLQRAEDQVRERMQQASAVLQQLVNAGMQRMRLALTLSPPPGAATGGAQRDTVQPLFEVAARVSGVMLEVMALHSETRALGALLQTQGDQPADGQLAAAIAQTTQACARHIHTIQHRLQGVDYPFAHSDGRITLNDHAWAEPLETGSPGAVQHAAGILGERLFSLQFRLVARLATAAQAAEVAAGLN
jgi:Zn-dependent protease with chaperone function